MHGTCAGTTMGCREMHALCIAPKTQICGWCQSDVWVIHSSPFCLLFWFIFGFIFVSLLKNVSEKETKKQMQNGPMTPHLATKSSFLIPFLCFTAFCSPFCFLGVSQ
jgi:hypothetical protein